MPCDICGAWRRLKDLARHPVKLGDGAWWNPAYCLDRSDCLAGAKKLTEEDFLRIGAKGRRVQSSYRHHH